MPGRIIERVAGMASSALIDRARAVLRGLCHMRRHGDGSAIGDEVPPDPLLPRRKQAGSRDLRDDCTIGR